MRYELIIYWSKEDQAFLVEVPEVACGRQKKSWQSGPESYARGQ